MAENKKISPNEEETPKIMVSIRGSGKGREEESSGFEMALLSPLAIHAQSELSMLYEHICAHDEEGEKSIDAFWARSMLQAAPAAIEILSRYSVLSNEISARLGIDAIGKLVDHSILTPLHGIDEKPDEWMDVSEMYGGEKKVWQNNRFPAVFYYGDSEEYINVECSCFREDDTGVTFRGNYLPKRTLDIFEPWLKSLKNDPPSKFQFIYNMYMGSLRPAVEMPYTPPNEITYYPVNWVAEATACGMNLVAALIDDPQQKPDKPQLILRCTTIHWGIYSLEYRGHCDIYAWFTFDGTPIAAPSITDMKQSAVYHISEMFDSTKEERDAKIEYAHSTLNNFASNLLMAIQPKIGRDEVLFLPKPSGKDMENWFITSGMIDPLIPNYREVIDKCHMSCAAIIAALSCNYNEKYPTTGEYDPTAFVLKWCPQLSEVVQNRIAHIDKAMQSRRGVKVKPTPDEKTAKE